MSRVTNGWQKRNSGFTLMFLLQWMIDVKNHHNRHPRPFMFHYRCLGGLPEAQSASERLLLNVADCCSLLLTVAHQCC